MNYNDIFEIINGKLMVELEQQSTKMLELQCTVDEKTEELKKQLDSNQIAYLSSLLEAFSNLIVENANTHFEKGVKIGTKIATLFK